LPQPTSENIQISDVTEAHPGRGIGIWPTFRRPPTSGIEQNIMTIDAALVSEQGVTFAVVCVRSGVTSNSLDARRVQIAFSPHFGGVPIVLMEQDSRGRATYFGRRDIVNFLSNISTSRLPWKRWNLN
jgi:hypothetical protein